MLTPLDAPTRQRLDKLINTYLGTVPELTEAEVIALWLPARKPAPIVAPVPPIGIAIPAPAPTQAERWAALVNRWKKVQAQWGERQRVWDAKVRTYQGGLL